MASGSLLLYAADQRSIAAFASSAGPATAKVGVIRIRATRTTCVILAIFSASQLQPLNVSGHVPSDLFDHLIGGGKRSGWQLQTERFGGLQIDDKFELGCLHDR